jgi:hypothetical protein
MRFQTLRLQTNSFRHALPSGNPGVKTQGLFKILSHLKKTKMAENKNEPEKNMNDDNETTEKESLEYLENCANAARETEALDQYDDYNAKE